MVDYEELCKHRRRCNASLKAFGKLVNKYLASKSWCAKRVILKRADKIEAHYTMREAEFDKVFAVFKADSDRRLREAFGVDEILTP